VGSAIAVLSPKKNTWESFHVSTPGVFLISNLFLTPLKYKLLADFVNIVLVGKTRSHLSIPVSLLRENFSPTGAGARVLRLGYS
jgi:hypothetical protein